VRHESGKETALTSYQTKNHISIPDQDEKKIALQPFQLPTIPQKRRKIIYKQEKYHSYEGGGKHKAPLLHFHLKRDFFCKEEKSPWGERREWFFGRLQLDTDSLLDQTTRSQSHSTRSLIR